MASSLRFDQFMGWALYDPTIGFYSTGRGAGRRGADFITSPELGPLFGRLVARFLDQTWHELGEPEPFDVAEAAAGTGTLARAILGAAPKCLSAMRYHLVEVAAPARTHHDDIAAHHPGRIVSSATWPEQCHVGLANELLDNLPTRVIDSSGAAPNELWAMPSGDDSWGPRWEPADGPVPDAVLAAGAIVPWAQHAATWVHNTTASSQRLVIIDYGAATNELAQRGIDGWLRAYRDHQRVADVMAAPGSADVTVDVPFDQLPVPALTMSQADWLRSLGIEALVADAATTWRERAHLGDIEALRARSTVNEAGALCDPTGLGGFSVLLYQ